MVDNTIALGVQPLKVDIATPLMAAAKLRAADTEARMNEMQIRNQEIGAAARGLAVYADKPEFAQKWAQTVDDLQGRGVLDQRSAAMWRDNPSPLLLNQIIASTEDPRITLQKTQAAESVRHNKALEAHQAATLREQTRLHERTLGLPVKIGTDSFGGDLMGVPDASAPGGFRLIEPKAIRPASPDGGGASAPSPQEEKDTAFDTKAGRNVQYLSTLDPDQRGIVRKVANYEIDPRQLSTKGGHRERVLSAVSQFDPNYDQKNYAAYSEGLKAFQNKKEGAAVRSFNVGIEHLDQLGELGTALGNGNIQGANKAWNWAKTELGYDGPTNFNGLKQIVGAEIVKAIVGAGGGVSEREEAAKTISAASSPEQLAGILKTYKTAMGAQLGGLQRQYEQATGRRDFDRLLSPAAIAARDAHNAHGGNAGGGGGRTLSGMDQQALDWANANPSDPRAAAIKKRLGIQ